MIILNENNTEPCSNALEALDRCNQDFFSNIYNLLYILVVHSVIYLVKWKDNFHHQIELKFKTRG